MKRLLFILVLLLLLPVMIAGCDLDEIIVEGSGNIVDQEEELSGFDNVDVSHSFKVAIDQGEDFRVVIHADDNLVDDLDVRVSGNTLIIGLDRNIITRNATLEAEVTMPTLTGAELSGASAVNIVGFKSSDKFKADLSGSSTFTGDLEAGDVDLGLSGSSDMSLAGSGGDLVLDASGSSDVDLTDFAVADANLNLSGSSEATVNVNGTLDVDASGASSVYYLGDPTLGSIDTSGSSDVEAR